MLLLVRSFLCILILNLELCKAAAVTVAIKETATILMRYTRGQIQDVWSVKSQHGTASDERYRDLDTVITNSCQFQWIP